jgi:hypothetical protein
VAGAVATQRSPTTPSFAELVGIDRTLVAEHISFGGDD